MAFDLTQIALFGAQDQCLALQGSQVSVLHYKYNIAWPVHQPSAETYVIYVAKDPAGPIECFDHTITLEYRFIVHKSSDGG